MDNEKVVDIKKETKNPVIDLKDPFDGVSLIINALFVKDGVIIKDPFITANKSYNLKDMMQAGVDVKTTLGICLTHIHAELWDNILIINLKSRLEEDVPDESEDSNNSNLIH